MASKRHIFLNNSSFYLENIKPNNNFSANVGFDILLRRYEAIYKQNQGVESYMKEIKKFLETNKTYIENLNSKNDSITEKNIIKCLVEFRDYLFEANGRPKKHKLTKELRAIMEKVEKKEISVNEGMLKANISRTHFYQLRKEYKELRKYLY